MISRLSTISFYLILAIMIVWFSKVGQSDYLINFLKSDLITLLIALMAINTTTSSVVMTKLKEISETNSQTNFSMTIKELKISFVEQIIHIVIAVIALMVLNSKLGVNEDVLNVTYFLHVVLIGVFIASIHNLYDTAASIFVILDFENKN